jgi:rhodanese-related sulfurtransferase
LLFDGATMKCDAILLIISMSLSAVPASAQTILDVSLGESGQQTADISTNELRRIIEAKTAVLLDARPPMEFSISHIPGAVNVAPKPGRPAHLYISDVAEVGRLLHGAKDRPLIIYCNGPFCGKSKRLAAELKEAGHSNVRRYQLGAPGWRALAGSAMQTELPALMYIRGDPTAVWIDAREPAAFGLGTVSGARNIPASGLKPGKDQGVVKAAKDDGRLPMEDHNTRIVVFGIDGSNARFVADAISLEAFHNVSFIDAPFEQVKRTLRQK